MGEIVVSDKSYSVLPGPDSEEATRRAGQDAARLVRSIRELFGTGSVVPLLDEAVVLLAQVDLFVAGNADLGAQLSRLQAKATKLEIFNQLALVTESRAKVENAVYGRMLIEDVGAQEPSVGAIIATSRRVRRTCKYRPEIAEVIEILDDEEYKLNFEIDAANGVLDQERTRLAAAIDVEQSRHRRG